MNFDYKMLLVYYYSAKDTGNYNTEFKNFVDIIKVKYGKSSRAHKGNLAGLSSTH